jgi:hypothetical protein
MRNYRDLQVWERVQQVDSCCLQKARKSLRKRSDLV